MEGNRKREGELKGKKGKGKCAKIRKWECEFVFNGCFCFLVICIFKSFKDGIYK